MLVRALVPVLVLVFARAHAKQRDFYSFKVVNSRGKLVSLEKYRGAVTLVVNVASECGYTEDHYRELQGLQRDLGPSHFSVLAFPCNQFGRQEPGSDRDILAFARDKFAASFPIFSKIAVVGSGANNAYRFLTESSGKEPDWNFWKYLVDADGRVVDAWGPQVSVRELRPRIQEMVRNVILKRKDEL
uniref:Glutathione peroxidase n=1 Tax=Bostrychus sinensis TaxID=86224 RepID=A0A977IUX4_9TELE|nr:glutathione peroxidase 7 [Bostrychus sinensis]